MTTTPRQWLAFGLIVLVALSIRLSAYEPVDRSVSNFDTQEFINESRLPFFSARFFSSGRPATMALLYKLVQPASGYEVSNLSSPGDFISPPLADQAGLGAVTTAQTALSIIAWLALAFVLFRNLRHPLARLLAPLLVLFFGFSPQAAEWDYILMSEPISFSLFILFMAISIELSTRLASKTAPAVGLWIGWGAVAIVLAFARDTNAYFLLVLIAATAFFLLTQSRLAPKFNSRPLLIAMAGLIALVFVQNQTAQASGRWINPFFNNLMAHVFTDSEHLDFFKQRGFPASEEVLALANTHFTQTAFFEIPYLMDWTRQHGAGTFISFIAAHPTWAWQTFADGTSLSFTENAQPFFTRNEEITPTWLVYVGDLLHPKDAGMLAVVVLELAILSCLALRRRDPRLIALAACLAVFFVGELAMLFVSILGDAAGIVRHTIGSLLPLRLSIWLLLVLIIDAALVHPPKVSRR